MATPLDEHRSIDRQLRDSGARLLVTEDSPTAHTSVATLAVDALNQCLDWPDMLAPPDPSALALLIYTSGTAGGPKGVSLDHATVDALAATGRDALELGPTDGCLQPLSHADGIVASVLTPLLSGASVIIADKVSVRAAHELSNGSNI